MSLLFVLSFCSRQSALTNQIFSCILKALRGRAFGGHGLTAVEGSWTAIVV